jgi:hypothetical protein
MKVDCLATNLYNAIVNQEKSEVDRIIALIPPRDGILLDLLNMSSFYDDEHSWRILHAAQAYQPSVVARLLKKGLDPNVQDQDGCTPLHRAVMRVKDVNIEDNQDVIEHSDCLEELHLVKLLLYYGADPNIPDHQGNTSLHVAASNMYKGINKAYKLASLIALLRAGADPGVRNHQGQTSTSVMKNPVNDSNGAYTGSSDDTKELWKKALTDYYYDDIIEKSLWVTAITSDTVLALSAAQHFGYLAIGIGHNHLMLTTALVLSATVLISGALCLSAKAKIECHTMSPDCEELVLFAWDEIRREYIGF